MKNETNNDNDAMFYVSIAFDGESEIPGCCGFLPVFESFDMALKCAGGREEMVGVLVDRREPQD